MKNKKSIFFILLILGLIQACDNQSDDTPFMSDCVSNEDIFFNTEMFEDCPAEAVVNLCSNTVCFDSDNTDFNFIIPVDGCTNTGCFDITCGVNEVASGAPFLGVAMLNINQIAGPQEGDLFSGTGLIDDGELFDYNCVSVIE